MSIDTDGGTRVTGSPGPGPVPETARQAVTAGWRRWRWILAVALVVVLAALIAAVTGSVTGDRDRLGPDNPGPNGSRALVRVLRGQGVDVQQVRRSPEVVAATGAKSTLVVTNTFLLGPAQLDRLLADDAQNLVLIEPDEITLSRLAPDLRAAGHAEAAVRAADCSIAAVQAAGAARAGGYLYSRVSVPICTS